MAEMEKYLKFWTENMRKQLGMSPKEDPNITEEEWNKMSPREKVRFIRDRREDKNEHNYRDIRSSFGLPTLQKERNQIFN